MSRSTDGTQPGEPTDTFGDPLSGLVSGDSYQSVSDGPTGRLDRTAEHRPAPDPDTVRGLVESVFAPRPEEMPEWQDETDETGQSTCEEGEPVTPVELPRAQRRSLPVPRERGTWPLYRRLTRQAWRPRPRAAAGKPYPPARRLQGGRPSRGAAGVVIAVALLVLFCFVALELALSLINMFSSIGE